MARERIIFDPGQEWLIKRAETLDPNVNKTGLCFAIANMAMQADFADDLETFENRLKWIEKIPIREFKKLTGEVEEERRKITKAVMDENEELPENEVEALENDEEVKEKLKRLEEIFKEDSEKFQKEKLTTEQIKAEFERRKKNILFNAFLQKKIDQEILNSEYFKKEKWRLPALDIPIFFQDVNLYHTPYNYPDLFEAGSRPIGQNTLLTLPLVAPKRIKEPSKISEVSDFSGAYTKTEVIQYFKSFSDTIEKFTPSITHRIPFILGSGNHAITVIYDPRQKNWLFIDANQLRIPTPRFSAEELGAKVTSAFSNNGITTFDTKIYAHQSNAETLQKFLNQWKDNETFKEIHKVTKDKARYSDSYNATWLYVAAQNGHTENVKALLEAGAKVDKDGTTPLYAAALKGHTEIVNALLGAKANPNLADKDGVTPLHLAALNGHTEIVNALLKAKAKPNLADNDGVTPLHLAAKNGHTEIVEALLKAQANSNYPTKDKTTPLFLAAQNGHTKVVEQLLAAKADFNLVGMNNVSPLFIAAQNGHKEVVLALLDKEASTSIAFKNNSESLLEFAKNKNDKVYNAMVTTLTAYQNKKENKKDLEISLTPKDIATIMGHAEIAQLLAIAEYNLIEIFLILVFLNLHLKKT